ncbi:Rop family plasmid primer RNA-binding protein, partial [Escherichia coli]|nr:Rop family plasmid primer RNA-binding protein [Escherichia coli]
MRSLNHSYIRPPYRFILSTDALRALMTKQQKTALNMAKFIQNQS